jgi:hypothetical protein
VLARKDNCVEGCNAAPRLPFCAPAAEEPQDEVTAASGVRMTSRKAVIVGEPRCSVRWMAHVETSELCQAQGDEDILPDVMSRQVFEQWRKDPKSVELQFASM